MVTHSVYQTLICIFMAQHLLSIMKSVLYSLLFFLFPLISSAQEGYEIQVYSSPTVPKGNTMVELHGNYTADGERQVVDGVYPTHHEGHATIEITHGFTSCFELGFYIFNCLGDGNRTNYVGSHIRPRIRVPDSWNWPVGVSLSTEVGFAKKEFSADQYTLEIRPIVDKTINKFYISLNPVVERSLKGVNSNKGFIFSPNAKIAFDNAALITPGLEYYGALGAFGHFDSGPLQEQQLFLTVDLHVNPIWEFNAGYGQGLTNVTDRSVVKFYVGRRF